MATANTTDNVSVGKGVAGGYFYTAPKGTALPTDYSTPLAETYVNCGFISDEGITSAKDSSTDTYQDLNGDDIATGTSSIERTIQLQFVEMRPESLKEVFGQSNVTVANDTITVRDNNNDMDERVIVMELVLKDGRRWRRVCPLAKVQEWDEVQVASTELVGMGVTYRLLKPDDGDYIIDYIQASA